MSDENNSAIAEPVVADIGEPIVAEEPEPHAAVGVMRPLETLSNVELAVTVELGRTRLLMRELLSLRPGSVVELDRHVGAPVDVFVNSTLLAHGEVVVVDDELGVRITAIAGGDDGPRGA